MGWNSALGADLRAMKTATQQVFVKRVEFALGSAILVGLTAWLTLIPSQVRGTGQATRTPMGATRRTVLNVYARRPQVAQSALTQTDLSQSAQQQLRQLVSTHSMVLPHASQRERVQQWFAAFDQIREQAKMSPMEKASAIRIWATSFATTSESDKEDARQLLTSMVQRYTRASEQIQELPQIPETRQLQAGYAGFFAHAKSEFEGYVVALDRQSTKAALSKMADGRQQLASVDVRNKNLDRRLREQFGIPQLD